MSSTRRALLPPPFRWREGAVVAVAFVLCLAGGMLRIDDTVAAPPRATYLIAVASCAVLPFRHRAPRVAMATTTVVGMLVTPLDLLVTPMIIAPAVVAAYAVGLGMDRRTATRVLLAAGALLLSSTLLDDGNSWQDASRLAASAAFPLVAGVLGHAAQNRRALLAAMEERAWRAEKSRESEALRRVGEERVRIARELHDLVAHQITLANAQATVAAHVFDQDPEESRTSLTQLVQTTSDALDDLRATVGLLRQSDDTDTATEPAPGLAQLARLFESFGRAGLEVSVHQDGVERALAPGTDLTAYRIIQEALTNVTKHAGTGIARVELAWTRERLTIRVADDGRAVNGGRAPDSRAPGYGLIGMRERASAAGGDLEAGPRPDGGFLVTAHLPLPPTRVATDHGSGGVAS